MAEETKQNKQLSGKELENARANGGSGRERYVLNPSIAEDGLASYAFADGEVIRHKIPRHYTADEAKKYNDKVRGKQVLVKASS